MENYLKSFRALLYFLLFTAITYYTTTSELTASLISNEIIDHNIKIKFVAIKNPDETLDENYDRQHHHKNHTSEHDSTDHHPGHQSHNKSDTGNQTAEKNKTDPGKDKPKDPNPDKPHEHPKPYNPTEIYKVDCNKENGKPCNVIEYLGIFPNYKEDLAMIKGTDSFEQAGGIVPSKNRKHEFLCKIKLAKACHHSYMSEMADRVFVVAPRYYIHQNIEPMLSMYHYLFLDYIHTIGLQTCVIEAIVESRGQHYESTKPNNEPWEIQTKIEDTFYIRENLLNVAAKKIIDHWDYLMWIDAHHYFDNLYWWEEAIWKMEHYSGVQFFQHLARLDEWNRTLPNLDLQATMYINSYGHLQGTNVWAGNAWGIRKDLYIDIGYILDTCISGGCDYSYTMASMKDPRSWDGLNAFPHYKSQIWPWIEATSKKFKGKGTYIRGFMRHFCHEHFFDYFGFLKQFAHCCFDINTDLKRDENFQLHLANDRMRDIFSRM